MNSLMSNLVKLYEELQELAREQRRRAAEDRGIPYHQMGYFTGLADANDNAARLLRAVLESSGIDVDQELSLLREVT